MDILQLNIRVLKEYNFSDKDVSRANWLLFKLGKLLIPMIGYVNPKVVTFNNEKAVVKIKYKRRTKNHLNSIYLGVLAVGADIAAGLVPMYLSKKLGYNLSLVFAYQKANYLKRAESDVYFILSNPQELVARLHHLNETRERETSDVLIKAYTNYEMENELLVAEINMGLSLKIK